ncbi:MAG: hypothetical protein HFG15_04025 [Bacilli bacterium]|jgi:hypothetical protein|nr:hypothetical protein [Bacilli bacterium]
MAATFSAQDLNKGIIFSKKFQKINQEYELFKKIDGYEALVNIKVEQGIIKFDSIMFHPYQLQIILETFYPEELFQWNFYSYNYIQDLKLKKESSKNECGFHVPEMIRSSYFGKIGEVLALCGLTDGGNSLLIFVPTDLSMLDQQQLSHLQELLDMRSIFDRTEVALCSECYEDNRYITVEELQNEIALLEGMHK